MSEETQQKAPPSPEYVEFLKRELTQLVEDMVAEGLDKGLTFDNDYKIKENNSGVFIKIPDICADAKGNPVRERVGDWLQIVHEEITAKYLTSYAGLKAALKSMIDTLPEDRPELKKTLATHLVCDDVEETFMWDADDETTKLVVEELKSIEGCDENLYAKCFERLSKRLSKKPE